MRLALPALLVWAVAVGTTSCAVPGETPETTERFTAGIFLDAGQRPVLPAGVAVRKVTVAGLELTEISEGFVGHLYNDAAGYCTIGFGHLIRKARCDGSELPEFLDGITRSDGRTLLMTDMEKAELSVMTAIDVTLTDPQYAALCDFVFNVGGTNFRKSTLRKVVNRRQFDQVATQLRRWVSAGGKQWPGLVTRREREIDLFYQGLPRPRGVPGPDEIITDVDIRVGE